MNEYKILKNVSKKERKKERKRKTYLRNMKTDRLEGGKHIKKISKTHRERQTSGERKRERERERE